MDIRDELDLMFTACIANVERRHIKRGQYEDGEQVDINTDLPDEPKQAKVSEGVEQIITDMLNENNIKDTARISPEAVDSADDRKRAEAHFHP